MNNYQTAYIAARQLTADQQIDLAKQLLYHAADRMNEENTDNVDNAGIVWSEKLVGDTLKYAREIHNRLANVASGERNDHEQWLVKQNITH